MLTRIFCQKLHNVRQNCIDKQNYDCVYKLLKVPFLFKLLCGVPMLPLSCKLAMQFNIHVNHDLIWHLGSINVEVIFRFLFPSFIKSIYKSLLDI